MQVITNHVPELDGVLRGDGVSHHVREIDPVPVEFGQEVIVGIGVSGPGCNAVAFTTNATLIRAQVNVLGLGIISASSAIRKSWVGQLPQHALPNPLTARSECSPRLSA